MSKNLTWLIVAGVVALAAFWCVSQYNKMVVAEENVEKQWSQVENVYQRRADLVPQLVGAVKGYAKHESDVFNGVAEARAKLAGSTTVEEKAEGYNQMQSALGRLLAIAENYPELKSNTNFQQLQDELAGTENRIAVARKRYNDSVRIFNTQIKMFPSSIVAGRLDFEKKSYFEIAESSKTAPKVEF